MEDEKKESDIESNQSLNNNKLRLKNSKKLLKIHPSKILSIRRSIFRAFKRFF